MALIKLDYMNFHLLSTTYLNLIDLSDLQPDGLLIFSISISPR